MCSLQVRFVTVRRKFAWYGSYPSPSKTSHWPVILYSGESWILPSSSRIDNGPAFTSTSRPRPDNWTWQGAGRGSRNWLTYRQELTWPSPSSCGSSVRFGLVVLWGYKSNLRLRSRFAFPSEEHIKHCALRPFEKKKRLKIGEGEKFKGIRPSDVLKVQEVGRDKKTERMPQGFINMLRSPNGQFAPAMLARCPISSEFRPIDKT